MEDRYTAADGGVLDVCGGGGGGVDESDDYEDCGFGIRLAVRPMSMLPWKKHVSFFALNTLSPSSALYSMSLNKSIVLANCVTPSRSNSAAQRANMIQLKR